MTRPASATNLWINSVGFISLLLILPLVGYSNLETDNQAVVALLAAVVPIILLDIYFTRVQLRESAGLVWSGARSVNWIRVGVKLVGLWATLTLLGICYWAASPEYSRPLYQPFWRMLARYGPWAAGVAIPYFFLIDARMRDPRDGYWHFGSLVLGRFDEISRSAIAEHLSGWAIKGFFLPLMFSYVVWNIPGYNADLIHFEIDHTFLNFFGATVDLIFVVDLVFGAAGYILMVRILDSHLRWAEPTAIGWFVAIICYEPFGFRTGTENFTDPGMVIPGLSPYPVFQAAWGSVIILLLSIYSWATVAFGCRFSNLTHRGIVTSGPYRFTKHPAYITKNISWWLILVPSINPSNPVTAIKQCLVLAGVNGIYYLRAKTEERNLRRDPVYIAYCEYIDRHGLFQWLRRLLLGGKLRETSRS
jgi:hypothetical protein